MVSVTVITRNFINCTVKLLTKKPNMKNLIRLLSLLTISGFMLTSCEGPQGVAGPAGKDGVDGINGVDANETCKECHNPTTVEPKATEYQFSKHSYGEVDFEEAGNTGCTPCHTSDAFLYVCKNSVPSTFTLNTTTGKYANDYASITDKTLGEFTCFTCHKNLHTTYTGGDFKPFTNVAAVSMTMWKGAKSIDLQQDGASSNLCIKCHQPRPLTTSTTTSNGDVVAYADLVATPSTVYYDAAVGNAAPNKVIPSYRTHVHYGAQGAIYAGKGGVEFTGSLPYTNSPHTSAASCVDCHAATVTARAGGHTFRVRSDAGALTSSSTWNFKGCNAATGCHTSAITATSTIWTATRTENQTLLNTLASKINAVGGATPILHTEPDGTLNLWAGLTTGNYDGYLNIYDPSTNPNGVWKNPAPSGSWTAAQKATNTALTAFPSLKAGVLGAMINFQLCLREYSLGIHNTKYSKALLTNSIETLTALGL
jgi:hypothetical protein